MSSQNWRFLTPSPLLVVFLLCKIGNFWPPLVRRHSLWTATWRPWTNVVVAWQISLQIHGKTALNSQRNLISVEVRWHFFWSWLQCRHWITLIWNWPSTAVDWMAARRRRVKSSPTYLLWAAPHCWRTWPFADVRLLVFHARTNILVWASRVLIFRRGFLLQGRWKGEGMPPYFQFS